jgi:hypothetical protein
MRETCGFGGLKKKGAIMWIALRYELETIFAVGLTTVCGKLGSA